MRTRTLALLCAMAWVAAAQNPCAVATAKARITPSIKAQMLRVSGRVVQADGKTPAAGVTMYIYHTGMDGEYGKDSHGGPIYRAWMKTDAQGRYEYETFRPAPYPGDQIPAHIHVQFWSASVPHQYADDLMFADDPRLRPNLKEASAKAGEFAFIVTPRLEDGALAAEQNFKLKPAGDRMEGNILHGIARCR